MSAIIKGAYLQFKGSSSRPKTHFGQALFGFSHLKWLGCVLQRSFFLNADPDF